MVTSAIRVWRNVGCAVALLMLGTSAAGSGCGAAGHGLGTPGGGGGGGDDPRCAPYCDARQTKGCGGERYLCMLACTVDYMVATSQGSCQAAYTTLVDCKEDPTILELGCAPPQDKLDAACKTQRDAYNTCVKMRDGT